MNRTAPPFGGQDRQRIAVINSGRPLQKEIFRMNAQNGEDKTNQKKSDKRKRDFKCYCVRVDKNEFLRIEQNAKNTGLKPSSLFRELGLGYEPKSTVDAQHILELIRLRGDLGRLGGLLKKWLNDSQKITPKSAAVVVPLLHKIEKTQNDVRLIIEKLE